MVIVIIGLLAGVAVVSYRSTRKGAEIKTTRALVRQVEDALERYNLDVKEYPTEDQGLAALLTRPQFDDEAKEKLWNGPYLKKTPKDAWGNELVYQPVEQAAAVGEDGAPVKPYKLYSKGPDGQEDSDDDVKLEEDEEEDQT